MLRVTDIRTQYGPVVALDGVSVFVPDGQIITVLGANGAGKSTLLRSISGLIHPSSGRIEYDDRRIDEAKPEQIVKLGISQVPEGRQIFTQLNVLENLKLGAYTRRDRDGVRRDIDRVCQYFPVLGQRRSQVAGTLSGGEQQMLAIARALMARPKLLLLDEPSLGLAPLIVREIFQIIQAISREGHLTVMVVEQDAQAALAIADYAYVLETGRVALADEAAHLQENDEVRRSYLGY
ncbi:MAG TPA: ABC transporter ATP-binding protein [Dehalococcoidia bacterium]|nr:ABC transporter ATP-binding protein [Dehalococcoidia bacterium]